MLDKFGACLVEEFIEGREFTVLVAQMPLDDGEGTQVVALDPVECRFSEGEDFKHYNLKWIDYEDISWHPVQEADLSERLKKLAVDVFQSIKGRGYGRMDVRSDSKGDLYFLEVNPNCGIFYPQGYYGSADFILDRIDPKYAHANFILNQVEVARALWKEKNQAKNIFEARYNPKQESWGLFALRDIKEGELIQEYEESAFHLVSRAHVLKHWKGVPVKMVNGWSTKCMNVTKSTKTFDINRSWDNFAAYCWPVSDNLFAMWDPNPDNWKPVNHHCNPNAWFEEGNGFNMVARRPIRRGEEICMDYATFVGYFPEMRSFQCSCGASQCRGEITGMDIVSHPELAQQYRGHFSDYLASKIGVLGDHAPQN
jgi:D-alanine-D-alanine ligase